MIYKCPTWAFSMLHRPGFLTRTLACHHWNVRSASRTEKKCYSLSQGPFSLNRHSLLLLTFLLLRPEESHRISDQSSQKTFSRTVVAHAFNPSTQEAEACWYLWVWDQPGLQELVPGLAPKPQRNPVLKNQKKKKHFQDIWPLARMKSLGVAVTLDIWSGNQLVTFFWSVLS